MGQLCFVPNKIHSFAAAYKKDLDMQLRFGVP
jgi:hypothetical protein